MAKGDCGRLSRRDKVRLCSEINTHIIDVQNRSKPEKCKGIRQLVLEAYHTQGIKEAYKVLEEYNTRFEKPVYTIEMFKAWIAEDDRRNKGQGKDDDDGR